MQYSNAQHALQFTRFTSRRSDWALNQMKRFIIQPKFPHIVAVSLDQLQNFANDMIQPDPADQAWIEENCIGRTQTGLKPDLTGYIAFEDEADMLLFKLMK